MIKVSSRDNCGLITLSALFMALLAVRAAEGAPATAVFPGTVSDFRAREIYHSPEHPGYTAWVGIWKLPDGTIQCDFVQGTGAKEAPVITYPVLQSTDAGNTWTRVPGDIPNGYSRGMTVSSDGVMIRPAEKGTFDSHSKYGAGIYHRRDKIYGVERSADGGKTWSQPVALASPADYQVIWPGAVKRLRDGRLVAFVALGKSELERAPSKAMCISNDEGQTWGEPIWLLPELPKACEESDFVELPGGDLLWLHRAFHYAADGKWLRQVRMKGIAKKVGDTFAPQAATPMVGGVDGWPCILMTAEGVILDLNKTASHWSTDQGQSWKNLQVNDEPFKTYYYPQAVQTMDGTIVVVGHRGSDNVYGTFDQAIMVQTFRLSPAASSKHVPSDHSQTGHP